MAGYGCCDRSIRVRVLMPSTSRIPTTATTTTSRRFSPLSMPPCPACTTGSTSALRRTGTVDASTGVPVAAGLDRAGAGGRRIRLSVLYGARAVAAGKERHAIAGKPANRIFPEHPAGTAENLATTAGFVSRECPVAQGDGDRALPAGRAGGGPVAGGRGRPGIRGAGAIRRRQRTDRPGRPWLRAARAGLSCASDFPSADRDRNHRGAAARLRADRQR